MKLHIFGESHAPEIGVEIEGVPKGTVIDLDALQAFLDRRAPGNGQGGMSTPRKEPDKVEFDKGVVGGVATGETIRAVIRNTNTRPQDYANVATVPRPGHADYASWLKCGKIPTGGGKWSGRMTAPLCIAGGIALQMLAKKGVTISSSVRRGHGDAAIPAGDSVGGVVEVVATGFPAGYGDVGTDGLESKLAAAFFGIPAVKGVEFGAGFAVGEMRGSENNDPFYYDETGAVKTRTNNAGGILGGITTGMPVLFRIAVKPTPSIGQPQQTVDLTAHCDAPLTVVGRHDPCIVPRAIPVAEAAAAIALMDLLRGAWRD